MKKDIQAMAGIVLFYVLLESVGITCPIRFLTGVSCAGCGMSRAWLALARLDLDAARQFHPLFWLPVPAAGLLLFRRRVPERVFTVGMTACGVLFLVVYLIRFFLPGDIVVFAPQQGLVWRAVSGVMAWVK